MKKLTTLLIGLTPLHRAAAGAVAVLAVSALIFQMIVAPYGERRKSLKTTLDTVRQANRVMEIQAAKLKSGARELAISGTQRAALEQMGTGIFTADEAPGFIELLRGVVETAGGKNVGVREGEPLPALVQVRGDAGFFTAEKLPLTLSFEGNFAEVSDVLFKLRGMRRFIGVPEVRMNSKNYTSELDVRIELDVAIAGD
ncbi:MAG: hypothetical protein AB1742_13375 [bacterium]